MRLSSLSVAALTALIALPAAAQEEPKRLNVYNWSDYIAEDTVAKFTEETGIQVTYDVFDSNDVLEAKLLAGSSGYDIVVPTGNFLARQIQAGVFREFDKDKMPSLAGVDPTLAARVGKYDPDNKYSAIYLWGTNGIGYNVQKVKEILGEDFELNTFDLLFKPEIVEKLAACGVSMLDAAPDTFPVALNYLGLPSDSFERKDLDQAAALLKSIRPHIKYFHSSQYINDLANGEICVAYGWSGDILQARDRAAEAGRGVEVGYVIPKEGSILWFDLLTITKDAAHPQNAQKFIDFILRPEIIAEISNHVHYANAIPASEELIDESVRADQGVYPPAEVMEKTFGSPIYPPATDRILNRMWTEIRTGR